MTAALTEEMIQKLTLLRKQLHENADHPPLHTDCYEFPDRILRSITELFLALIRRDTGGQ